jgi:serine/threonine-protein kinase RsbW
VEASVVTKFRALYPSAYESVAQARRAVGSFAHSCGYGTSDVSDIVLAVGEACSNAVEHGHVERGHFDVSCVFEDDLLSIEIRDDGRGFVDVRADKDDDPSECIGRGRGIRIMRALMDSVRYASAPSGTIAVLEKRMLVRGVEEPGGELRGSDAGGRC